MNLIGRLASRLKAHWTFKASTKPAGDAKGWNRCCHEGDLNQGTDPPTILGAPSEPRLENAKQVTPIGEGLMDIVQHWCFA